MRIAIVSDLTNWAWAGCEELWAAVAKSALSAGNEVALFLARSNAPAERLRPLEELGLGLHLPGPGVRAVETVRRKVSWKVANLIAPYFRSFDTLKAFAPQVVLINSADTFPNPLFLSQIERSGALEFPYVILCHSSFLFERPAPQSIRSAAARYYAGARLVLFVAERTRMEAEHLLGTQLPNVRIVRNPVNMSDLGMIPLPETSTAQLAAVGRIATTSKGQDILLASLGTPRLRSLDWKLSIYGTGPDTEHLQQLAQHYRISERVAFRGHCSDVRSIWAENHLLAMPSRVESAPLALVEAMLCGRPAVVNDVGGVLEWASEPETAFVSHGTHIESFTAALERAFEAKSEWPAMSGRARERALSRLDPDPGSAVLKLIESL